MKRKRLSSEGFARAAAKFKLLADPTRLRILDLLREHGELTVGDIGNLLEASQPTASRQLAKLYQAHMIARRRDSNSVYYFIEDQSIFEICEAVCGRLEREASHELQTLYVSGEAPQQ